MTRLLVVALLWVTFADEGRAAFLWGSSNAVFPAFGTQIHRIDPATGTATPQPGVLGSVSVFAATADPIRHPNSTFVLGVRNGLRVFTVDPWSSTVLAESGPIRAPSIGTLAADPTSGLLYATQGQNNGLYTIDPVSGTATRVAVLDRTDVRALAFDRNGSLFGGIGSRRSSLITINKVTGETREIGSETYGISEMEFRPEDGTLFVLTFAGGGQLATINTTTGAATVLGPSRGYFSFLAFTVPEPAGALVALSAVGATALRRRRCVGRGPR